MYIYTYVCMYAAMYVLVPHDIATYVDNIRRTHHVTKILYCYSKLNIFML